MALIVGIPACNKLINELAVHYAPSRYGDALMFASGAMPILLPPVGEGMLDMLDRLDGLLLDGSPSNVEPALARVVGQAEIMVNSLHEQALDRVADGLVVEGVAEDGTVEAVRVANARSFAFGVQFHPEWHVRNDAASRAIFAAFGEACAAYAAGLRRAA